MTLRNMRHADRYALVLTLLLGLLTGPATAQSDRISCTGIVTETETGTSAWPLRVIQDAGGHYICTIDRTGSGRDPLKPCSVGGRCSVTGTSHKFGQTYSIQTIISVDRAE
jgi:hypothetical protein